MLRLQRSGDPATLRSFAPDVPPGIEAAIHAALSKEPDRRFPSCESFAVSLGCKFLSEPRSRARLISRPTCQSVEGWSPHPVRLVLTQAELLVIDFYPHRGSLLLAYDSNVVNFIYRNMVEEFGNHNIVAKIDRHLLSGIVAVKAEEPCRIRTRNNQTDDGDTEHPGSRQEGHRVWGKREAKQMADRPQAPSQGTSRGDAKAGGCGNHSSRDAAGTAEREVPAPREDRKLSPGSR